MKKVLTSKRAAELSDQIIQKGLFGNHKKEVVYNAIRKNLSHIQSVSRKKNPHYSETQLAMALRMSLPAIGGGAVVSIANTLELTTRAIQKKLKELGVNPDTQGVKPGTLINESISFDVNDPFKGLINSTEFHSYRNNNSVNNKQMTITSTSSEQPKNTLTVEQATLFLRAAASVTEKLYNISTAVKEAENAEANIASSSLMTKKWNESILPTVPDATLSVPNNEEQSILEQCNVNRKLP